MTVVTDKICKCCEKMKLFQVADCLVCPSCDCLASWPTLRKPGR